MRSTFHSLEVARRGLTTQQTALQVTGHNIANANTPGYSRQRVNFVQTEPYPPASMNRPQIPGQLGTGVEAGSIQRVRESFLDIQFRGENNKFGYWSTKADSLQKMEEIMNEPSDTGLSKTLDRFWQSFQDLAVNPTNTGARSVVRQRGIAVAETFNYLSDSMKSIQQDLKNEINVTAKQINSLSTRINNLNEQIASVEPHGLLPNDLYDERDRLVDELSQLVNIKVTPVKSGGNALEIAEGKYTIELVDDNGVPIPMAGKLVDGQTNRVNHLDVKYDNTTGLVSEISIGGIVSLETDQFKSAGKLKALFESHGYMKGTEEKGLYPEMLKALDTMAFDFITEFNRVHTDGWSVSSIEDGEHTAYNFFAPLDSREGAAKAIKLDDAIYDSLNNIAASSNGNLGDGQGAIALAEVKNSTLNIGGDTTTIQNFYESLIGSMAVDAQEANRLSYNSDTLRLSVDQRRQSVSSVSLDEEMTNMIQFQHAYNASARMITATDEILDRIINGMGLVGR
ncbi:flagellar hook-associated protein FlgK [Sutcliffiella cohnii]|uniref:flagellar hook-associated protein FlgK n=1 Tax=Sutcliffiella cohnii TaxID=33932 RepID=UPI002E1BC688|nr:flagellar hook-associated protein FlgK [Sutcliffiella cohnii]MED4019131.1 flagellar hook-associated protein FlgK [Sutcliffiella cohnii]